MTAEPEPTEMTWLDSVTWAPGGKVMVPIMSPPPEASVYVAPSTAKTLEPMDSVCAEFVV